MAKREVVTLNETASQLQVPQVGDTYYLVRDVSVLTGVFTSEVVDGASAVGFNFDTPAYVTAGAKLASWKNNGTEKAFIDKDGDIGLTQLTFLSDPANRTLTSSKWSNNLGITIDTFSDFVVEASNTNNSNWIFSIQNGERYFGPAIHSTGDIDYFIRPRDQDAVANRGITNLTVRGGTSAASPGTGASIYGGFLKLEGGNGSSGSAGAAHGGDVSLKGGTGYGTGVDGKVNINSVMNVGASFTVSGLPTGAVGDVARVTDATAPSIGSTVSGGGSAAALVWYNGTNWTVMGI